MESLKNECPIENCEKFLKNIFSKIDYLSFFRLYNFCL